MLGTAEKMNRITIYDTIAALAVIFAALLLISQIPYPSTQEKKINQTVNMEGGKKKILIAYTGKPFLFNKHYREVPTAGIHEGSMIQGVDQKINISTEGNTFYQVIMKCSHELKHYRFEAEDRENQDNVHEIVGISDDNPGHFYQIRHLPVIEPSCITTTLKSLRTPT